MLLGEDARVRAPLRALPLPHTGGPPLSATFAIVLLLDEAFAATSGGCSDLVIAAGSPELQVLRGREGALGALALAGW